MNIKEIKKLQVTYNGIVVGTLYQNERGVFFQYDRDWLRHGFSISPMSLPLKEGVQVTNNRYFDGLPGVFADSLPDGWGELLTTKLLAYQGISYAGLSPLAKLSILRSDGLGGLSYLPNQPILEEFGAVDLDVLAENSRMLLEGRTADLDEIYAKGGSSGGARPKCHVDIDGEKWIVKFPMHADSGNVGYDEFIANEKARQCGIHTAEFRLLPSRNSKGYFASKRFDREGEKRLHVVSVCGLLETTHHLFNLDYRMLFSLIARMSVDKEDFYEAFGRMAFNVYYVNKDDHGKNFSFIYDERKGGYLLSPAYDLTRSDRLPGHSMAVLGKGNPSDEDMLELASLFHLSRSRCIEILENVKSVCKR